MRFCLSILLLWLLVVDNRADDADTNRPSSDTKSTETLDFQFDGVWKPKGAMLRGVLLPPPALKAITLRIEGCKYEVTVDGEEHSDKGTFTVDENVTPKRMTIKSVSGPNKGKTFLAIYEIKGANAMRVCYDLSGRAFPEEFKAPKDTDLYLVGYRRQQAPNSDKNRNRVEREPAPKSKNQ